MDYPQALSGKCNVGGGCQKNYKTSTSVIFAKDSASPKREFEF